MTDPTHIWHLDPAECRSWRGSSSAEGTFTRLYIRYREPATGTEGVATAQKFDAGGVFLLERVVPAPPAEPAAMTAAEAQELADTAIRLLGGTGETHLWAELSATQLIPDDAGIPQPARQIKVGDTVRTTRGHGDELLVSGVTPADDDTILVNMTSVDPKGFDVAARLMMLDVGGA